MNLPSIFDWLDRLAFLRGTPAAYGVIVTGVIILLAWDWRLTLLALFSQYMVSGFLFVDLLDARLVNVKVLVGMFATLILYLTARQVNWGKLPVDVTAAEAAQLTQNRKVRIGPFSLPTSKTFRVFVAVMMVLVVLTLAHRPEYQLPGMPSELGHIHLAVFALVGLGLVNMGLTSEPMQVGVGALTFFTGFELFYSALEQSVAVLAALAAVNLALTLAVAYLMQARHAIQVLVD